MTEPSEPGRAQRVVRDSLTCVGCRKTTHHLHATRCPDCGGNLENSATYWARSEGVVIAQIVKSFELLANLANASAEGCRLIAMLSRHQGDDQTAVVMETRAETCARFGAWALSQHHEVLR